MENKVTMLILICSSAMQQWFSQPPLPMLSTIFLNAGVITIAAGRINDHIKIYHGY
jgi:hypothetical protein